MRTRQAPPPPQHPGTRVTRVTGGTKKLLGHSLDPPPRGCDPRMTHGRQRALTLRTQPTPACIHTYKTQISQNNTYRYYAQRIRIFDSFLLNAGCSLLHQCHHLVMDFEPHCENRALRVEAPGPPNEVLAASPTSSLLYSPKVPRASKLLRFVKVSSSATPPGFAQAPCLAWMPVLLSADFSIILITSLKSFLDF